MTNWFKEQFKDPEVRERWRTYGGTIPPIEARRAKSEYLKQQWKNDGYRRRMIETTSKAMKEKWQDQEFLDKIMPSFRKRLSMGIRTDIETITEHAIKALGLHYEFNYRVGRYFIDFALLDYMVGVECDGVFWHRRRAEKDALRDRELKKSGWLIVRLSEKEIHADIHTAINNKVLPLLKEGRTLPQQLSLF